MRVEEGESVYSGVSLRSRIARCSSHNGVVLLNLRLSPLQISPNGIENGGTVKWDN